MKRFLIVFLAVGLVGVAFGQIGKLSSPNTGLATNAAGGYYTSKQMGDISAKGAVIVASTTWPGLTIAAAYNPRRDSSVFVHYITKYGDTCKTSIAIETGIPLPGAIKIITATSSDSTIIYFYLN